ncbi:MAG: preprotein translocase subunit SecE [Candidatus Levybacteria bacterium RIFCSPLOWO2_01_FULL_42_15]|nr:MAG: preprotein translocase subunit SecE [Candidatus Levybacteria bacterium RIFCSPLOWO2_01_FULL_42_15]
MAVLPVTFLREVKEELKKVVWPTQQEIVRMTILVLMISIIVGVFIGGIDFVFVKIMEVFIK